MARREQTELDRDLVYDRWKVFGSWLTAQRLQSGLTQNEVAKALGISRQQWIRYELGAKVLSKRMPAIEKVLNVSREKMLDRAGFKASPKRNAAKYRLTKIYDLLCAGKIDLAILELLRLSEKIAGSQSAVGPRSGGLNATNFAKAIVLLEGLPDWYLEVIQKVLQERVNNRKHESEMHPRDKNLIKEKCIEALRRN